MQPVNTPIYPEVSVYQFYNAPNADPTSDMEEEAVQILDRMLASVKSSPAPKKMHKIKGSSIKRCLECGTHTTPIWRKGADNLRTLCNACGIRYKRQQSR